MTASTYGGRSRDQVKKIFSSYLDLKKTFNQCRGSLIAKLVYVKGFSFKKIEKAHASPVEGGLSPFASTQVRRKKYIIHAFFFSFSI